jgi:eukaryotic-like serine/threonine-protein kinase
MLTVDDDIPPHEHRSAELTRPFRLSRLAIVTGAFVTAGMFAMLGLGITRDSDASILQREIDARTSNIPDNQRLIGGMSKSVRSNLEEEGLRAQQMLYRSAIVIRPKPGAQAGRASIRDLRTGKETPIHAGEVVEIRQTAGHIVFVRPDGTLWAAPFDRSINEITAAPVKIADSVSLTGAGGAPLAVTASGSVAYVAEGQPSLALVSREGKLRNVSTERHIYSNPRFSPDGKRISVDFYDEQGRDVWTIATNGGRLTRATFLGDAHDASWTPDSQFISYTSFRLGALGVYRSRPGDRESPDSLFTAQPLAWSGEWLKDGRGLITVAADLATRSRLDIALIGNGGRGPLIPVLTSPFQTRFPAVSPNGLWVAYVSNESSVDEVYVRRMNGSGPAVRLTRGGGIEPVWRPDGKEIFYRDTRSQFLIGAAVRVDSTLGVIDRRPLFPVADMIAGFTHANYDISPDGMTFVMIRRSAESETRVLENLPEIVEGARARQSRAR